MAVVRKTNTGAYGSAIISETVKSHANDPFFVKKLADAKEALAKITLPVSNKK